MISIFELAPGMGEVFDEVGEMEVFIGYLSFELGLAGKLFPGKGEGGSPDDVSLGRFKRVIPE